MSAAGHYKEKDTYIHFQDAPSARQRIAIGEDTSVNMYVCMYVCTFILYVDGNSIIRIGLGEPNLMLVCICCQHLHHQEW